MIDKNKQTKQKLDSDLISKQWDELTFSNDFIFAKVMLNPELCKGVLERLLSIRIDHIDYPEEQKTIDIAKDSKSVRLDVYVADEKGTVYNVEMQTTDTRNLPKRSRYYQSMIDLNSLEKGKNYAELPQSFVIFICKFDPFDKGLCRYTFVSVCKEDSSLALGDGTIILFFNSAGKMPDKKPDPDLEVLMKFIEDGTTGDVFTRKLEEEVEIVKQNQRWKVDYMTLTLMEQDKFMEGRAKGRAEGEARGKAQGIINTALDFNCTNDDILLRLQQKLGISESEAEDYLKQYYDGEL